MTSTLAAKVIEGFHNEGWKVLGRGGTWAGSMRPLEKYVQGRIERAVKVEREACAKVCEDVGNRDANTHAWDAAAAIRARGNT